MLRNILCANDQEKRMKSSMKVEREKTYTNDIIEIYSPKNPTISEIDNISLTSYCLSPRGKLTVAPNGPA